MVDNAGALGSLLLQPAQGRPAAQSLVDSFEGRDQWLASGMETGVEEGYAKLDALVAEL